MVRKMQRGLIDPLLDVMRPSGVTGAAYEPPVTQQAPDSAPDHTFWLGIDAEPPARGAFW